MSEDRSDDLRDLLTQAMVADATAQGGEPPDPAAPPETPPAERPPGEQPPGEQPPGEQPPAREQPSVREQPAGREPSETTPPAAAEKPGEKPAAAPAATEWQPPADWSAQDRERYGKLDENGRRFVADLDKRTAPQRERLGALERDYGYADKEFFTPQVRDRLRQMNRSVPSLLNDWASAEMALMTGNGVKERMVALIMSAYGCDGAAIAREYNMILAQNAAARGQTPPATGNGYAQPNGHGVPNGHASPGSDPYDARIRALETTEQRRIAEAWGREQETANQKIAAFREERDTEGNLLHPHFPTLQDKILTLADRDFRAQRPIDLGALYTEAAWGDPAIRQELLQQEHGKRERAATEERKQKAEAARRTAASINGSPGPGGPGPDNTGDDNRDLRTQIRQAMVPARGGRI